MCAENDDVELVSKVNDMILKAWAMNLMNLGNAIANPCFWTGPYCPHFGCISEKKNQKTNYNTHNWRCFKRSVHSKAHHRQMTQHFVGLDKREK
jgi:hypothetical protein